MRLLTFVVECVTSAGRNALAGLVPSHSRSWGHDVVSVFSLGDETWSVIQQRTSFVASLTLLHRSDWELVPYPVSAKAKDGLEQAWN